MAQRRADAGIKARLQPCDPRIDLAPKRLVETLADVEENLFAPQRGKGEEREVVAACVQTARKRDQRLTRHRDHRAAMHGAFRRARGVEQHGDGEIALVVARIAVQAVTPGAAGAPVG